MRKKWIKMGSKWVKNGSFPFFVNWGTNDQKLAWAWICYRNDWRDKKTVKTWYRRCPHFILDIFHDKSPVLDFTFLTFETSFDRGAIFSLNLSAIDPFRYQFLSVLFPLGWWVFVGNLSKWTIRCWVNSSFFVWWSKSKDSLQDY